MFKQFAATALLLLLVETVAPVSAFAEDVQHLGSNIWQYLGSEYKLETALYWDEFLL